jgi:nitric oxide reductase NorQ protein
MLIPEINPFYECPMPAAWERLAKLDGINNILLTGPTGSGKTSFAEQFAASYNRPCFKVECGAISESDQLLGSWQVVSNANGTGSITIFNISGFLEAVQRKGSVVLLNELNRLQAIKSENALMSLLDYQRELHIPELNRTIHVAEGVQFFATINEGSEYTATDLMDYAMRSRFPRRYEIDFLPQDREALLLTRMCEDRAKHNQYMTMLDADNIKNIVRLGNNLRGEAPISFRQMQACAEEMMLGAPIEEAVGISFGSLVDMDEIDGLAVAAIPNWKSKKSKTNTAKAA